MHQVCLIEEIIDEVIEESSIEDPLEACFAQFGEDLDLDKLIEQADALWRLLLWWAVKRRRQQYLIPPRRNLSLYQTISNISS